MIFVRKESEIMKERGGEGGGGTVVGDDYRMANVSEGVGVCYNAYVRVALH